VVTKAQEIVARLEELAEEVAALRKGLDRERKSSGDLIKNWGSLLTPIVVAVIGYYATCTYNEVQQANQRARDRIEMAVQQVQTVEKFIPHLMSHDVRQVGVALNTVAALGNDTLTIRLAVLLGDSGSRATLSALAQSPDTAVKHAATVALATLALRPDTAISRGANKALSRLYPAVRPSVVRISSDTRPNFATGFFVDASGLVATQAWVAQSLKPGDAKVHLVNDVSGPVEVVRVDTVSDLALLRASVPPDNIVPLTRTARADTGMRVFALGQAPPEGWTARVGTVTALGGSFTIAGGERPIRASNRIVTTDISAPGFAGAPVLDMSGALIGIIEGGARGVSSILIPAEALKALLRQ
jgi:S1-C subfamily serine protease